MPITLLAAALLHQHGTPKVQAAPTIKALYERCRPSVVSIEIEEPDGTSTGTGFFYENGRTVVTSFHLVVSATKITVRDDRGKTWRPKTVAIDLAGDTAILGLGVETGHVGLKHAPSQEIGVGDEVLVIGDPEGLRATLSTGIVSALRTEDGVPLVQITAPVSHGSSGGPVLDRKGRVLGVVRSSLREGQNLNLAVSTQVAKWILARRDEISYQSYLEVIAEVAAARAKASEDEAPAEPPARTPSTRPDPAPREGATTPSGSSADAPVAGDEAERAVITESLATLYTDLFVANDQWRIAWYDGLAHPDDVPQRLKERHRALSALIRDDLRKIATDAAYGADFSPAAVARVTGALRALATVCDESLRAELDCLDATELDEKTLESANALQISQRQRRAKAIDAVVDRMTGDFGLSEDLFIEASHPIVMCARLLDLCWAIPDYDLIDEPTVGTIIQGSGFRVGDVITGVRAKASSPFVAVASWEELRNGVYDAYTPGELDAIEFRVRRGTRDIIVPCRAPR